MTAIQMENVTKTYKLRRETKTALENISFQVESGQTVGIIGRNGSGKSTLLKLLAGITAPTRGRVKVTGKVEALLELGAGFHGEYTGKENIYINGVLRGKTRKEIREKIPEILAFSGIGDAISQKVKTYSTGMVLRLAFAAAVAFPPKILLVDEALAVGDLAFQVKCFEKLRQLKEEGCTILFVSHDIDMVRQFCSRVIWLDKGRIREDGEVSRVTGAYMAEMVGQGETLKNHGFGTHPGTIKQVVAPPFWEYGKEISVQITVDLPPKTLTGDITLSVKNKEGLDMMVFSAKEQGVVLNQTGEVSLEFRFRNLLCGGDYLLAVGVEIPDTCPIAYYEYREDALKVRGEKAPYFGMVHIPGEVRSIEKTKSEHHPDGRCRDETGEALAGGEEGAV